MIADTPAVLMAFDDFTELGPDIVARLFRNIAIVVSERLEMANQALARVQGSDVSTKPPQRDGGLDSAR